MVSKDKEIGLTESEPKFGVSEKGRRGFQEKWKVGTRSVCKEGGTEKKVGTKEEIATVEERRDTSTCLVHTTGELERSRGVEFTKVGDIG